MRKHSLLALVMILCAVGAQAQNTDIEALSGLMFNFGNPGARSLGMGGAFLGLADDASAAEANPAGLTVLIRPEVTMELRHSKTIQTLQVDGVYPDVISEDYTANSNSAEIAFASFVIPRGNFRIAGYYHSVMKFENEANALFTQDMFGNVGVHGITFFLNPGVGPCPPDTTDPNCIQYRTFPYFTAVDISLKTWGLATAYKLGDNFSIGASFKYQQFEESALSFRTDFQLQPLAVLAQQSDDDDYAYTIGFKYGGPRSRVSFGGVYKTGGSFVAPVSFGTFDSNLNMSLTEIGAPKFNVPTSYGLGLSYNPAPSLKINIDAVQINYSELVDDLVSVYDDISSDPQYEREDVLEYHVGAEWFFLNSKIPWAIRGGWWRDPEHALKWTGPVTQPNPLAASILFPEGQDEDHYSIGIGIAFTKLQVDAAYDTSDSFKVGSISAKYVF